MREQGENEGRVEYLLLVLKEFIGEPMAGGTGITYDLAECDGHCLLEDLENAFAALPTLPASQPDNMHEHSLQQLIKRTRNIRGYENLLEVLGEELGSALITICAKAEQPPTPQPTKRAFLLWDKCTEEGLLTTDESMADYVDKGNVPYPYQGIKLLANAARELVEDGDAQYVLSEVQYMGGHTGRVFHKKSNMKEGADRG